MTHATEHITDPSVFRLRASATETGVLFAWDYPGATLLRVRIQRSRDVFADDPDDEPAVVYDGVGGSFRDADVDAGHEYLYTVWARHAEAPGVPPGPWGCAADRAGAHDELPGRSAAGAGTPERAPHAAGWVLWERLRIRACGGSRLRRILGRLRGRR